MMHPFHRRLAEIWAKVQRNEKLSTREIVEWIESLHAHMHWVSKLNRLENLAFCAEISNDEEWLHEICREMDKLIYRH